MTHYTIEHHEFHTNNGINKERCLEYYLTGKPGKHDNLKWYEGSDIPEYNLSVKSAKFSLCSGGHLRGESLGEMLDDFFARVASTRFAYVTVTYEVYEMDKREFREFLEMFGTLSRESTSNGGKTKIKGKHESKAMLEWFALRVA